MTGLARLHARILLDDPTRQLCPERARRLAIGTVRAWARDYRIEDIAREHLQDIVSAHRARLERRRAGDVRMIGAVAEGALVRDLVETFVEITDLSPRDPALAAIVRVVTARLGARTKEMPTRMLESLIAEREGRRAAIGARSVDGPAEEGGASVAGDAAEARSDRRPVASALLGA